MTMTITDTPQEATVVNGYSRYEAAPRRLGGSAAGSLTFGPCRCRWAAWRQVSEQYFRSGRPVTGFRHLAHGRAALPSRRCSTESRNRRTLVSAWRRTSAIHGSTTGGSPRNLPTSSGMAPSRRIRSVTRRVFECTVT
jgi:hypothetical protein